MADANQMVKAYDEIISVKIGQSLVSMTIVEKQNESGLKFNERLFILVHNDFFGYVSKVKINQNPQAVQIATAKVKIPIKNFYTAQTEDCLLKIKFTHTVEGKIAPKEWIFRMTTNKLAQYWKQLLQYQFKLRNKMKTSSKSKKSAQSLQKKNNESPQKTLQKVVVVQNKNIDKSSQSNLNNQSKTKPAKIQITTPQAAGTFEDGMFSDQSDNDKKAKNSKRKTTVEKQPNTSKSPEKQPIKNQSKIFPTQLPQQSAIKNKPQLKQINVEEGKPASKPIVKKQEPQQNIKQSRLVKKSSQSNLPRIEEQLQSIPSIPIKPSRKEQPKNVNNVEKKNIKQKTSQQLEAQMTNEILMRLQQKNSKYPFSQITYDRQEMATLVNVYKDKLSMNIDSKRTQNLLNLIIQKQKQKLGKVEEDNRDPKSWIYRQIVEQQTKCLASFQQYCQILIKQLVCELYGKQFKKFKKIKQQNKIMYFQFEDIQIKVPLTVLKVDSKDPNIKLLNYQAQKILKQQFKCYQYLNKIIQNRGNVRVPLVCLCQYGGIISFVKVKPVFYQNDKYSQILNQQINHLQTVSSLPLKELLKGRVKPLNQFHYSQMRRGDTGVNFKYHFVDEINNIFVFDFSDKNISKCKMLRMQLIQQSINRKILPLIKLQSDKSNMAKEVSQLSQKMTLRIQRIINSLNNIEFYFVSPKELSNYLHSAGVNMRYLGKIYSRAENLFIRSGLLSEMMARICKKFIFSTLQDVCFEEKHVVNKIQDLQILLKSKLTDFLNCLFGNNLQSQALWKLIIKNAQDYYKMRMDGIQNLSKGQLLVSLAYHLCFKINWKEVDTLKIFTKQDYFKPNQITMIEMRIKSYKPFKTNKIEQVCLKLQSKTHQNFSWLIDNLKLKQNYFPVQIKLRQMQQDLKLYLANFIEPQQIDWANNFAHLCIYANQQPTLINLKIDVVMISWFLKKGNKFKYLNKFNDITRKVLRIYGNNHPILSELYELFSKYHQSKYQAEDSINFMKSSILNVSALTGDNNLFMAEKLYLMAQLLLVFKRDQEAFQYLKKAKKTVQGGTYKRVILYGKIKLQLAMCYFGERKYNEALGQLENVRQFFQIYEKDQNSYEEQRLKLYQLVYLCCKQLNKNSSLKQLSISLESKLKYFKNHSNFQEILWIIIQTDFKNMPAEHRQAVFKVINMIKTKQAIQYYKKSYQFLRKRENQSSLFRLFKSYSTNSVKIFGIIVQKRILDDWTNLSQLYERESLFDFISMLQELIYLLGRDRLNTILINQ